MVTSDTACTRRLRQHLVSCSCNSVLSTPLQGTRPCVYVGCIQKHGVSSQGLRLLHMYTKQLAQYVQAFTSRLQRSHYRVNAGISQQSEDSLNVKADSTTVIYVWKVHSK